MCSVYEVSLGQKTQQGQDNYLLYSQVPPLIVPKQENNSNINFGGLDAYQLYPLVLPSTLKGDYANNESNPNIMKNTIKITQKNKKNSKVKPTPQNIHNKPSTSKRVEKKKLKPVQDLFCLMCNLKYDNAELLQEHKEKKGHICRVCTSEVETHDELELHFDKHNNYKCENCSEVFFTRKDIHQHKKEKHNDEKFECLICHKSFTTSKSLTSHKWLLHKERHNNFDCVVCGKIFKLNLQWKHHMNRSHSAYQYVECRFCQKLILGPEKLKDHIKGIHLDSEKLIPARCQTCGKVYKNKIILRQHEKSHDDSISLCDICGKSVKGKVAMKTHMDYEHSKTGVFTCKSCNKQFELEIAMKKHVVKFHRKRTVNTPVCCEICGKKMKSAQILKFHKLTHLDDKPFKCDICGAAFKQKVALRTHGRVHSNIGKYTCNDCGMTFKWKQTFDKHIKKCEAVDGNVSELKDEINISPA